MKLIKSAETFNLGDTSFRRHTLIDDYKTLLPFLKQTHIHFSSWDNQAQSYFYKSVLNHSALFERNSSEDAAKRGRTLTNALVKIGLTDNKRQLSEVANNWVNSKSTPADTIERVLGLDINNIVFLRQLLKLRVYDSNSSDYFYPFRVGIYMLSKYQSIPQKDFLTLIHLIKPTFDDSKIRKILDDYEEVNSGKKSFSEFLDQKFPDRKDKIKIGNLLETLPIDQEKFNLVFVNRKTSDSQEVYFEFVTLLIKFKKSKSKKCLHDLLEIAQDERIKKAFGFGKSVFEKADNIQDFCDSNKESLLLSKKNKDIYAQFVLSKKDDIVREYRDMTKRTFNLTGLIDFSNGLVTASNQDVLKIVFEGMSLAGSDSYDEYEQDLSYPFYQDVSLENIIHVKEKQIIDRLKEVFNVKDLEQIKGAVASQKEEKLRRFVECNFSKDKILKLLPLFSRRDDLEIQKQVSENATVPTIFEYIIAIAWSYISSEKYSLIESMNLTLDGNMLPLSHATGGEGDIVIKYPDLTLMLEVTLMNRQAQKRGEWEPVLRHATNLTIDESPKNVVTLFIADELDRNTINIWRAIVGVPLQSSNSDKVAEMVKIFPLKNNEVIRMLKNGCDETILLETIERTYSEGCAKFNIGWRKDILKKISMSE